MKKIAIILFAILLVSCSAYKVARTSAIQEIQFGNGGGVTGAVTTYSLKADGSLWKGDDKLKTVSCDTLSSIIKLAETLPKENFVHPNNVYTFVRIIKSGSTYYYAWSLGNSVPDKPVTELYIKLNKQL